MSVVPEASTVKRSLSAHAAVGLLAGALLYIVCLAGTVLVFYDELQRIEQPDTPEMTSVSPAAVQRAGEALMASEQGKPKSTHLYFQLPSENFPRATANTDTQTLRMDGEGRLHGPVETKWSTFLYAVHYRLQIPSMIGGITVGILGVMILALSISGVVALPRIFRDAFRLRARDGGGIGLADWHNRLSVWTLPFAVMIALTGAVIGLAGLTVTGIAERFYGGDTEQAYAPIFGGEHPADLSATQTLPPIAGSLEYIQAHYPGVKATYLTVHDPLTRGQSIQIMGEHPRRLIFGEYYNFDAAGKFIGVTGLSDGQLGQQAAASNYTLHFGSYGGVPVKIAYFIFGLALTAVCASGTYIWLGKRRRRGIDEPRLLAAWDAVVWGVPVALTVSLIARFVAGNEAWFGTIFWGLSALILIACIALAHRRSLRRPLQQLLVACILAAAALAI